MEKGQEHYLIGLNIDILEDKTGNLKISDVPGPTWSKKFKKNSSLYPNFGVSKSSFWARFKVKNLDPSKK
ncbi:MAG: 7TM-DISM domain-containing protein, partial [Bdellovibrionota bacterium]|nr:7TM-DISM domain-containing protein [Bdellovibrionota bacterium]